MRGIPVKNPIFHRTLSSAGIYWPPFRWPMPVNSYLYSSQVRKPCCHPLPMTRVWTSIKVLPYCRKAHLQQRTSGRCSALLGLLELVLLALTPMNYICLPTSDAVGFMAPMWMSRNVLFNRWWRTVPLASAVRGPLNVPQAPSSWAFTATMALKTLMASSAVQYSQLLIPSASVSLAMTTGYACATPHQATIPPANVFMAGTGMTASRPALAVSQPLVTIVASARRLARVCVTMAGWDQHATCRCALHLASTVLVRRSTRTNYLRRLSWRHTFLCKA